MLRECTLLVMPIHKRSQERYRADAASYFRRRKWLRDYRWPVWILNDIMGFVEIGDDLGDHLTGEIFLKRKYISKADRGLAVSGVRNLPSPSERLEHFGEVRKRPLLGSRNADYVAVIRRIISDAESLLRTAVRGGKTATVWIAFDLACIDFAAAHREVQKERRRLSIPRS